MKYNGVLIRYNELALKGKNRIYFEKKLISNIQRKLPEAEIQRLWGRIFLSHGDRSQRDLSLAPPKSLL